jgi:hypothetical protein
MRRLAACSMPVVPYVEQSRMKEKEEDPDTYVRVLPDVVVVQGKSRMLHKY